MEAMMSRSPVAKEENRAEDGDDVTLLQSGSACRPDQHGLRSDSSSPERKDSSISRQVLAASTNERSPSHAASIPSSSCPPKDSKGTNQADKLESTRAEMGEVKHENERLKTTLAQIMKDYQSLQTHFFDIIQRDNDWKAALENPETHQETDESDQLVTLSLGTNSGGHKKEEKAATGTKDANKGDELLSLGLDCKFDTGCSVPIESQTNASPESSFEEAKEEAAGEPWPPSKMLKTMESGDGDASEQNPVKRARVSVRVRCDAPTMNDGCQWRKYGQKTAKGNPCPRAYYRCTVAPACPVRKQVQRCAEDMSILITTYEGTHNHPLTISATAMASTTSAAASMLMSGSSTSQPATGAMAMACSYGDYAATSNIASLHGLNFGLPHISRQRQFYPPNPSIISNPSCPTITLDLTAPSSSSPSTHFSRLSSSFPSSAGYSQTGLTFAAAQNSNTTPTSWSSGYLGYVNPYNTKSQIGFSSLGRIPQDPFYSSFLQKATNSAPLAGAQSSLTDTAIAAATKAITADPSFQSALAAAITSIVGGNGSQGVAETLRENLRREEQVSPVSAFSTPTSNGINGCATSYLTRSMSSSSNPQLGNLMFLQPSPALPSSKSASGSPVQTREHINS